VQVAFTPDPKTVLMGLERATILADVGPVPPNQMAPHVFRLLRPQDLVVLDVQASGMELHVGAAGAELVPTRDGATLRVRFAFQHVGERAFFTVTETPPGGFAALAAQSTRLVYDVARDERIPYTQAGVLAALSRLPLRVAPLATKAPIVTSAGQLGAMDGLVALAGGYLLGRTADGRLALTKDAATTRRRGTPPQPSTRDVISQALSLRSARALLSKEVAIDYTGSVSAGGLGDFIIRPDRIPPIRVTRPRAPALDETAIEAPFRLILSPSPLGGFAHSLAPVSAPTDDTRVELWHTRLGVRTEEAESEQISINEQQHPERIVRAIWARDKQEPTYTSGADDEDPNPGNLGPFRMSLTPGNRVSIVRQSADPRIAPPTPIRVERLALSSLGAFLELHGLWPNFGSYQAKQKRAVSRWDHEAMLGRDQYVRVDNPGYLFPFGHKCVLITITERKIRSATTPVAYLHQRQYIGITEPTRRYADRRMPFAEITLRPLVTPDIDPSDQEKAGIVIRANALFWPFVKGHPFEFTLNALDRNGRRVRLQAPLLFVSGELGTPADKAAIRQAYALRDRIAAQSQRIAFAAGIVPGDTELETGELRFTGTAGAPGSNTSTPELVNANAIVPAMRHLSASAPPQEIVYHPDYLAHGFAGANAKAQRFVKLPAKPTVSFRTGTDRAGGFLQPDIPVHALSRELGAVDDGNALTSGTFDPAKFLENIPAKLFGLFPLSDLLQKVGLDAAPRFITEQLDRVTALLADLDELERTVSAALERLNDEAQHGATAALKQQSQAAHDALAAVADDIDDRVKELRATLETLLDLGNDSSIDTVTAEVSDTLDALRALLADVRTASRTLPLPPAVRAPIERLLDAVEPALAAGEAISATIEAIRQFVEGLDPSGAGVRARFDWRPALRSWPNESDPLLRLRPDGLLLSVDARASGTTGVGVDVLAELRDFSLRLFPGEPLMALHFDRLAFRAASGRKPEVDAVFRGIEFLGILSFIETLKKLIPFDGFSDPPYVDVTPAGVTAGFDLPLPNVAVGVFSLENISFGADARVPFIGDEALTVGFNFCTRDKPFRMTVMMIGGGGFVGIRLSPKGLVVLEMALEAGASLSINLGVASGSVSVMVGVYLKLEGDAGSLTGYFRIRGEVDVMGLISASITLELALRYEFASGKMVGRASVEIEVDVLLASFTVTVTCERRLAGSNNDPTFGELLGVLSDGNAPAWSQYCAAFAEA
jgi:hypothetical protein